MGTQETARPRDGGPRPTDDLPCGHSRPARQSTHGSRCPACDAYVDREPVTTNTAGDDEIAVFQQLLEEQRRGA